MITIEFGDRMGIDTETPGAFDAWLDSFFSGLELIASVGPGMVTLTDPSTGTAIFLTGNLLFDSQNNVLGSSTITSMSIYNGSLVLWIHELPPTSINAFIDDPFAVVDQNVGQGLSILGGSYGDIIGGDYGSDIMVGRGGDDTLLGYAGNDSIAGGDGNDSLVGGDGNDSVQGNAGNDMVSGALGNDTLTGGAGADTLDGGTGSDTAGHAGIYRQYLVTGNPAGSAIIDGPEGTDSLASIEALRFVDGSLNFDPYSHVAQVYRLYEATLNRAGDVLGVNYHTGLLDAGWTLSQDASFFVTSPEFQGNYGSLTNTQFVELVYQNVLHRAADGPGLAYWTGLMSSGWTKGDVVVSFSESAENVGNHAAQINAGIWDINEMAASVARLYWGTLDRAPDAAGLIYWAGLIQGGYPIQSTAANFVGSPEFQGNYGSLNNTQFVNQLYLNVLDRPADSGGLAYWTGLLTGGATRGDVTLGFTESTEFQVNMLGQIEGGITFV